MKIPRLGEILGWKNHHEPGFVTKNDELIAWPVALGPWPTEAQLQQWAQEYHAVPEHAPGYDKKVALRAKVAQATTIEALKAVLREIIDQ